MNLLTGRPDHIEDALIIMYEHSWFTWTDPKNKVYANLRLSAKIYDPDTNNLKDNPHTLPSESDVNAKLKEMQDAWDLEYDSYRSKRRDDYPKIAEQLDMLYKDIKRGYLKDDGDFYKAIKAIKDKYPKS